MAVKVITLVAIGALGVGNLLHFFGVLTPEWDRNYCAHNDCKSNTNVFGGFGALVGIAALAMAVLIFAKGLTNKSDTKSLRIISLMAAIASFVLIVICVIIYAEKGHGDHYTLDLSLTIAGALLILLGGCIAMADNLDSA
ncbi:hypothetical protein PoB_003991900 [Plakobranchus ocellatus]|uniref:Uncharacterized protein n=1 Tax=Plakobranchus ocellatus TaxID=259542 RepID=A0AAV4B083_9GAST|nr:hypothetical protein PoB_003991900 [Plakobranchus ocellatus]